jgi:hypothetical protein
MRTRNRAIEFALIINWVLNQEVLRLGVSQQISF